MGRRAMILGLGIVSALLVVLPALRLLDLTRRSAAQNHRIAELLSERDELRRRAIGYDAMVHEGERIAFKGCGINILPTDRAIPEMLFSLSSLARQAGADLTGFSPLAEVEHTNYIEVPIRIDVEGTFDSLHRLLDALGKLHRIVRVENVVIAPIEAAPNAVLWLRGRIVTYRSPQLAS